MKRYLGATKIFFYFHLYPKLYGTEIEIWAGFGSAGSTENFCNIAKNFEGHFLKLFSCPN